MKKIAYLVQLAAILNACTLNVGQELYEKQVNFPENATEEMKVEMASRVVPSARQLEWQKMELTAFLHFGINTFTGREWGDGTDGPELFYPEELDAEQWVRALKDGGFKMAILTAKHHDGFCLWPTRTTEYSVRNSPWKEGKGDVVRELCEACRKYGLKFGVYLSPWDRNAECYGDSPVYNRFFIEQLTELLSDYGQVHEVWFDGACAEGPNGRKQEYDWPAILNTIHTLQPEAVTAIMGDDVRWVGNEGGLGRETEWSVTALAPGSYVHADMSNQTLGIGPTSKDLGSREIIAKAGQLYWYPSEVDVSIRPGWFYHKEEDEKVRSLENLVNIYFSSVGRNSVLLLNIPPDRRGLIHETDVQRLKDFSEYLTETFTENHISGERKMWMADAGDVMEFSVKEKAVVNTFLIQEDITKGQRVEKFTVEFYDHGQWRHAVEGTTVGYKRLLRFPDCRPEKMRITILETRATASISEIGLYYARPLDAEDAETKISDVSVKDWKTIGSDAEQAIDGNLVTSWKSEGLTPLTVDMGEVVSVAGFCYAPVRENDLTGTIYKYEFHISLDGEAWIKCDAVGEFSNIMNNPAPYFVRFGKSYPARYFRLTPLQEIAGRQTTTIGDVGILLK